MHRLRASSYAVFSQQQLAVPLLLASWWQSLALDLLQLDYSLLRIVWHVVSAWYTVRALRLSTYASDQPCPRCTWPDLPAFSMRVRRLAQVASKTFFQCFPSIVYLMSRFCVGLHPLAHQFWTASLDQLECSGLVKDWFPGCLELEDQKGERGVADDRFDLAVSLWSMRRQDHSRLIKLCIGGPCKAISSSTYHEHWQMHQTLSQW